MKCENCLFNVWHRTGDDEYPANTFIPMCGKGHWIDNEEYYYGEDVEDKKEGEEWEDPWGDCNDFKDKVILIESYGVKKR